ncbi:MAG: thiamine pyrophosphate-dependent enzyme [Rhodococcus sp. (in: high G+C Gram-positive bacteria)]|nr:thiamine pyrophosphate-dependent enzyme [Rhodococcus sp. (in: high G+C Gram-positive bacteria)]
MDPLQILDMHGHVQPIPECPLEVTPDLCRELYSHMRRARRFDDEAVALQRQGELGLWLQSNGQEAAQIGSITALRPSDYVFPSYREHAAALTRGIEPAELLVQWRGNAHSGWDPAQYNFHIYTLVLAAQLPHATGYAMGVQRDDSGEVVVAYVGDGATSEGDASEAFNWAAAADVPIVFFCQNNQWAISTPASIQMRTPLYRRAEGFGLQSYLVDGNDVLAVRAVTSLAVERVRDGQGPAFIEARTYRMGGHSTSDDPTRYRAAAELDSWREQDPIRRMEKLLDREGWAEADFYGEIDAACDLLATQTRSACLDLRAGDFASYFDRVLSETTTLLAEQQAGYREFADSLLD